MKTNSDTTDVLDAEILELSDDYRGMMPEARVTLREIAARFRRQFPARQPVVLRLVSNHHDLK
jgi:hypothetical protein